MGPVKNPRVINMRLEQAKQFVPVSRPYMFGNPYVIGRDGSRVQVIAKYRVWLKERLRNSQEHREYFRQLVGWNLGCFCAPLECHATVLLELLERYRATLNKQATPEVPSHIKQKKVANGIS